VALKFYRVHLPCRFSTEKHRHGGDGQWYPSKPGVLYYNPEYDFLRVSYCTGVANWAIEFIEQLKTVYDPRHVGLCNVAVKKQDLQIWAENDSETEKAAAFIEIIANLREVFFLEETVGSRMVLGHLSDLDVDEVYFNRSLPILPPTSGFRRIGCDSRPIAHDLTRIVFSKHNRNPLETLSLWRHLCKHWGASCCQAEYRFVVAERELRDVLDRACAERYVQREYGYWRDNPVARRVEPEDLTEAVKPSFGFWLFPMEAFGPMAKDGMVPDYQAAPDMKADTPKDVTPYWPELVLSDLF
jgi:hypothetical protein